MRVVANPFTVDRVKRYLRCHYRFIQLRRRKGRKVGDNNAPAQNMNRKLRDLCSARTAINPPALPLPSSQRSHGMTNCFDSNVFPFITRGREASPKTALWNPASSVQNVPTEQGARPRTPPMTMATAVNANALPLAPHQQTPRYAMGLTSYGASPDDAS